ncbi:MAG TPA: DUF1134 domain-containing protein [Hyphomicrobiaceae bacterium]|nr:DUF1134 domain-containing protein [Hyphomicrobiaceae bacterium]
MPQRCTAARSSAFALALTGALVAMLALLLPASPVPAQGPDDAYRPPVAAAPPPEPYYPPGADPKTLPGQPYPGPYDGPAPYGYGGPPGSFSSNEIVEAGHRFFGATTKGLASAIEYAFQKQGYPNGYILGQDLGGAIFAGLRYGEGMLYTKDAGTHRVYWQGPSIGYDLGGDGSKVMVLVYNLRDPTDIYRRFGGVDGSAYMVGGVGLTFQKNGDIVTAPIRTGLGLRLGASIGYLKYTPQPTWDPF